MHKQGNEQSTIARLYHAAPMRYQVASTLHSPADPQHQPLQARHSSALSTNHSIQSYF